MPESPAELKSAQETEFRTQLQLLQSSSPVKRARGFMIRDGLLYRKKVTNAGTFLRLCLPQHYKSRVMSSYHDNIMTGNQSSGAEPDTGHDMSAVLLEEYGTGYPEVYQCMFKLPDEKISP